MPSLSAASREALKKVSSATLTTVLFKRGLRNVFLQGIFLLNRGAPRMVGEAFTLRYIPAREDLNPMEEAEAYQRLLAEFGWTQEELAQRVQRDRSSIANCLRLLKLPELIQADLRANRLTMGHARALLSLTSPAEQLRLREEILAHSWSVRTTEQGVQAQRAKPARRQLRRSPDLAAVEDSLRVALATRVRLVGSERAGRIEIAYSSREELDRLAELITTRPR